jgi:protein gp37
MAENTKIEWATHTFNPWIGCSKVSPACDHCYAEHLMDHRHHRVDWGGDRIRTSPSTWKQPLKWNREAAATGDYTTVFCLSLGDIWDNEVDPMWRRDLFALIESTPALTWLLLSKRIGNALKMCDPLAGNPLLPPNAALGATMVNQEEWDRDMPKLKWASEVLSARFTFASVEPMLGPIVAREFPDWVITGGESGQHARPSHPDWFRSLRDQCAATGVPYLHKQNGEWASRSGTTWSDWIMADGRRHSGSFDTRQHLESVLPLDSCGIERVGKKAAGRLLDGIEHNGYPRVTT